MIYSERLQKSFDLLQQHNPKLYKIITDLIRKAPDFEDYLRFGDRTNIVTIYTRNYLDDSLGNWYMSTMVDRYDQGVPVIDSLKFEFQQDRSTHSPHFDRLYLEVSPSDENDRLSDSHVFAKLQRFRRDNYRFSSDDINCLTADQIKEIEKEYLVFGSTMSIRNSLFVMGEYKKRVPDTGEILTSIFHSPISTPYSNVTPAYVSGEDE